MDINKYTKWVLLKKIYLIKRGRKLSISELANEINIDRGHPYFYEILGKLIDEEVIVISEIVGNVKLLRINKNKLKKILEDSEIYKEFKEFVYNKTDFYAGV